MTKTCFNISLLLCDNENYFMATLTSVSGAVTACSFARIQQPGEGPPSLYAAVLSGVFCCSTTKCCESSVQLVVIRQLL